MPEVFMQVEWPGKQMVTIYSPSTVIKEMFTKGEVMSVSDFEQRVTIALQRASQRVAKKFGYECSSAHAEIARIRSMVGDLGDGCFEVKVIYI